MGQVVSFLEHKNNQIPALNPADNDFFIVFGREMGGIDHINDLFGGNKFMIDVAADWLKSGSKFIVFSVITEYGQTQFTGYPVENALDLHNLIREIAFGVDNIKLATMDFFGLDNDLAEVLAAQWRSLGGRHCTTS